MANTTIQTNNKLVKYTQEINREWVRQNMFSPYMGEEINSIIRRRMELKSGGEQMNIPLVRRLRGGLVETEAPSASARSNPGRVTRFYSRGYV